MEAVDVATGRYRLNGEDIKVDLAHLNAGGMFSLIVDGRPFIIRISGGGNEFKVQINGVELSASVWDERTEAVRQLVGTRTHKRSAPGAVRAPMPGMVVKVFVKPGEKVKRGEPVAVVEAMKMENIIPAPIDGVVVRVNIAPGTAVEKSDVLLVVEGG